MADPDNYLIEDMRDLIISIRESKPQITYKNKTAEIKALINGEGGTTFRDLGIAARERVFSKARIIAL